MIRLQPIGIIQDDTIGGLGPDGGGIVSAGELLFLFLAFLSH
jgi:hypothetical protein